jgi:hypothetical protein
VNEDRIDIVSAAAGQTGNILIEIETEDFAAATLPPMARSLDLAAIGQNVDRLDGIDPVSRLHANLGDPGSLRNVTIQEVRSASAAGDPRLTNFRSPDGGENQSDRIQVITGSSGEPDGMIPRGHLNAKLTVSTPPSKRGGSVLVGMNAYGIDIFAVTAGKAGKVLTAIQTEDIEAAARAPSLRTHDGAPTGKRDKHLHRVYVVSGPDMHLQDARPGLKL